MKRLNLFALGLLAFLLVVPQAARALNFVNTVDDQTFTVGTPVSITLPQIDTTNCFHNVTIYELSPALPPGLSFAGGGGSLSETTLLLSGTPTQATAQTQYTYTARERGGCYETATATFNITVLSACTSKSTDDLKADCAALESLYDSAGGANWANNTNWKTSNPLGQWHGITEHNGRVSEIKLFNNALTGTIPDLSSLTGLIQLDLGSDPERTGTPNSLSGTIPDLSALTKLYGLKLDGNSLSGSIPDLRATKVRTLLLSNNNIGGNIPAWLNDMDFRELALHDNRLSGTVPDLSNLDGPDTLDLSNNRLSGSVPDLRNLLGASEINLSNNRFGGVMNAAHFPVNVQYLYLNDNQLSGTIPDLSSLTKLVRLKLHNNKFSGTIPDLSSSPRLGEVWLNGNSLSGTIDVNNFDRVYFLYLHDNKLSSSVDIDLSSLSSLLEISLWGNPGLDLLKIKGVDLKVLEKAALWILYDGAGGSGWRNNSGWLYGYTFGEWHGVTTDDATGDVTGLNIRNNNLRGKINSSIAALASLTTLNLSCNSSLSGELPLELKDISGLTSVNICSTGVTSPGDSDFTTWKNGINVTFTDGTCIGANACPAPVSQQSSPPVSPASPPPDEEDGSGKEEGNGDNEVEYEEEPVVSGGVDMEGGGCALVSAADEPKPGGALGLVLAASALLLAVSRRGRRQSKERRHPG